MKTVEQLIFEKRFKDAEFDPNDYNDWAKENEWEAYTLCLAVAKQLQIHSVSGLLCPRCKSNEVLMSDKENDNQCKKCNFIWA